MTLKPQYAQFTSQYTFCFRCAVVVCHILHDVVSLSWHCAGSVRDLRGAGHNTSPGIDKHIDICIYSVVRIIHEMDCIFKMELEMI